MKMHLAAGEHARQFPSKQGWVNIDGFAGPNIDMVVDLLNPGWADQVHYRYGSPDVVYVGHFLEHMTPAEGRDFLVELKDLVNPAGYGVFVGPDVAKANKMVGMGQLPYSMLDQIGAHGEINLDDPTDRRDVHLWDTNGAAIVGLAIQAGWTDAEEIPIKPWPLRTEIPCIDSAQWQYLVRATP